MEKNSPVAEALKAKTGERPKRRVIAIVGSVVAGVALTAGGIFGVSAANAYRADIEAMQTSAENYYEAAEKQSELAQAAAESAAVSAQSAQDAVTVAEAEQAALVAVAEAQVAQNISNGLTAEGKCPAGTKAGAVDDAGVESSCAATNGQGQQCVAYDDANNCTQYYKP